MIVEKEDSFKSKPKAYQNYRQASPSQTQEESTYQGVHFRSTSKLQQTPTTMNNTLKVRTQSLFSNSQSNFHRSLRSLEQDLKSVQMQIEGETKAATLADTERAHGPQIPTLRWCAYCKRQRATQLTYKNGAKTLWSSVAIFFMGGFLGCFMIPYMTNHCKYANVVCHNCKKYVSK